VLRSIAIDPSVEQRILALDPERVGADDVRNTLACGPTPHIMNIHGGIYPVHLAMTSFTAFLVEMGYPERKIRAPGEGNYSHSPYESSERLAGLAAWRYEQEATRVMLVGHSQGGMQTIKVLHALDGAFSKQVRVTNGLTGKAEKRTSISDPLTGLERPVVGVSVAYATAVGAGGAAFILPNQWSMFGRLRTVPDTTDEFTGFFIAFDTWAWNVPGSVDLQRYEHNGSAQIRNVSLPAHYNHVVLPAVQNLALNKTTRDWIEAYVPGTLAEPPNMSAGGTEGIVWAADVWYSVKKHWTLEAQRVLRARSTTIAQR
jgi:pimeloyl-ACP methyl ester carboxylesterase